MILCAVFRAILRPAAEVADGCLLRFEFEDVDVVELCFEEPGEVWVLVCSCPVTVDCFGFICIIFRARVGGGGKAPSAVSTAEDIVSCSGAVFALPDNVRLRWPDGLFMRSSGDCGGECCILISEDLEADFVVIGCMAGGGRVNPSMVSDSWITSFAVMSVEVNGVGGGLGRGIVNGSSARRYHAIQAQI